MNRRSRPLRLETLEDRRNPTSLAVPSFAIDPTFGTDGAAFVETPFGPLYGNVTDSEIDAQGRIWALGTLANNPVLARFLADGTPDASFDGDGLVVLSPWEESISSLYLGQLELLPGGGAVVGGTASRNGYAIPLDGPTADLSVVPGPFQSDFVAIRLNDTGALDTTFGTAGRVVLDLEVGNTTGSVFTNLLAMERLPDGRIAIGGSVGQNYYYGQPYVDTLLSIPPVFPSVNGVALARLTADGTLDTTYDGDGIVTLTPRAGNFESLAAITVRDDGTATVLGSRNTSDNLQSFATAYRFGTTGAADAAFDGDGYAEVRLIEAVPIPDGTATVSAYGGFAANQPDGGTVFATTVYRSEYRPATYSSNSRSDLTILRFQNDGSIDEGFGTNGTVVRNLSNYASGTVSTTDRTRSPFAFQTFADGSIALLESTFAPPRYALTGDALPAYNTAGVAILTRYDAAGRPLGDLLRGYEFIFPYSNPLGQNLLPRELFFDDVGRMIAVGITDTSSVTGTRIGVARFEATDAPANAVEQTILVSPGDGEVVAVQVDGRNAAIVGPGARPFGTFAGQVQALLADLDGDGVPEEIYGIGDGGGSEVLVAFPRPDRTVETRTLTAFEDGFRGGVSIAAGDLDGDGQAELIVSAGNGGGGRVQVYSVTRDGTTKRADFFGIDDDAFRGGATAALADVDGDGAPDLLVAAGVGGGPRVAVFDGATIFSTAVGLAPPKLMNDFYAFGGDDAGRLRNGVTVSAADLNGDGRTDLLFGAGPGGARRVLGLDGALFANGTVAPILNFYVDNDDASRAGVQVRVKDVDQDGRPDIVVQHDAQLRIYDGERIAGGNGEEPEVLRDLIVVPDGTDGIYVG